MKSSTSGHVFMIKALILREWEAERGADKNTGQCKPSGLRLMKTQSLKQHKRRELTETGAERLTFPVHSTPFQIEK